MLLLGVVQAQAIGVPVAGGSFDLLQSEVLTGSAASVTFSGLSAYASTYQHLQIRAVGRSSRALTNDALIWTFNGATSNYKWHRIQGNGSAVASYAEGTTGLGCYGALTGNTATTNSFGDAVIDILDPFSSTKGTTTRTLSGRHGGSDNLIELASGAWFTTDAVTSITFYAASGNLMQYSRFSLYGVKKAA